MNSQPTKHFVLGCGRLGSTLTPLTHSQSLAFIRQAFALGVRHYDTASIYGQGDSERLLGEALREVRGQVAIATKAGQQLTPRQRLLRPFKPLIRGLIRKQASPTPRPVSAAAPPPSSAASLVAAQRARGVAYCFEPEFLLASLDASLRRLRSQSAELFYLHSPPPQALARPEIWRALDEARRKGRIGQLGVSCDDLETAEAALACEGLEVLQFEPDGSERSAALLDRAANRSVRVHARVGARHAASLTTVIAGLLREPAVGAILMGTTRADHLADNLRDFALAAAAHPGQRP